MNSEVCKRNKIFMTSINKKKQPREKWTKHVKINGGKVVRNEINYYKINTL